MSLSKLISIKSATKTRVGRGISAGQGKTSGRGTKGQKSRSGYNIPRRFEGGQTPLVMRLPKFHGVKSFVHHSLAISWHELENNFNDGDEITREKLWTKKLIDRQDRAVKVIGSLKRNKQFKFASDILLTKKLSEELNK